MTARPRHGRDDKICVAQIGAPHGLKGEVRLHSFTERPGDVAAYGPFASEDGKRRMTIVSLRPAKDHFVVKFQGIDDRNAAELLRNMNLYVARGKLPPTADVDTYYHADLIGLPAVDRQGAPLGAIAALHNFGAGDLIELRLGDGRLVMLPFSASVVPHVDLQAGRVVVDPPAGALDEASPPKDRR